MTKSNVSSVIKLKCPRCGRETFHSLMKDGGYSCNVCGKVNKYVKKKEVVFKPDFEVENSETTE